MCLLLVHGDPDPDGLAAFLEVEDLVSTIFHYYLSIFHLGNVRFKEGFGLCRINFYHDFTVLWEAGWSGEGDGLARQGSDMPGDTDQPLP